MRLIRSHKVLASIAAVVLAIIFVVGAYFFQPWRLFTSSTVDEALPAGAASSSMPLAPSPSVSGSTASPVQTPAPVALPTELASGTFQSQEHTTTGTATLVRLPDGSRLIRLENLASSDGPDVKIWLSELEAGGDWYKYRSGRYVDLGLVKATHGNQNYIVPADADLSGLTTVVLWCDRFSVAFGSAALS